MRRLYRGANILSLRTDLASMSTNLFILHTAGRESEKIRKKNRYKIRDRVCGFFFAERTFDRHTRYHLIYSSSENYAVL